MYGYVLQDWITIRGASGVATITQTETDWLGLAPYQDAVFWIDVREITTSGNIAVNLQTAPIKDEALFVNMKAPTFTTNALTVLPVMAQQASTSMIPLARWVRWQLQPSTSTATWDITFRILIAANAISAT